MAKVFRGVWGVLLLAAICIANETSTPPVYRQPLYPEDISDPSDLRHEALSGWVRVTNQFIQSVLDPHHTLNTTIDWVVETVKETTFSIGTLLQAWKPYKAFATCVVFGFLYTAIMFLVLILFPCFRSRGKCGGLREQEKLSANSCRIEGVLLFVVVVILLTSVSAMFLVDHQLSVFSNGAPGPKRVVAAIARDSSEYVNHTMQGLSVVVSPALEKARELADKTVQSIGTTLTINAYSEIPVFLAAVSQGLTSWKSVFDSAGKVGATALAAGQNLQELHVSFARWKMNHCGNDANCLGVVIPDSLAWVPQLDLVQSMGKEVKEVEDSLTKAVVIGQERLAQSIIDVHQVVLERVDNLIAELQDITQKIPRQVSSKVKDILVYTDTVISQQEIPRKGITAGVSIVVLLIVAQLLFGLVLGCCQYSGNKEPYQRSPSSNFAGFLLMATVYVMLFFAPFFMLLTTHLFMVGGLVQSSICVPLNEPNLQLLDQAWEHVTENGIVKISDIPLHGFRPSVFMTLCQGDAGLPQAMSLTAEALADQFDIQSVAGIEEKLGDGFLPTDLRQRSDVLRDLIDRLPVVVPNLQVNSEAASELKSQLTGLSALMPTDDLRNSLDDLISTSSFLATLDQLMTVQKQLQNILNDTLLQTNAPELVMNLANDESAFWNRIIVQPVEEGVATMKEETVDLLNDTLNKLQGHSCKPVFSMIQRVTTLLCKVIVDPVNGFWFGLGACVTFFIPAIVLATKLSKHYYRTKSPWRSPRSAEAKPVDEITMESFKGKEHRQW